MNLHLGPLFRALRHGRGRAWLISLEIAFALAVIANCLNLVGEVVERMDRDTGLDEEHLLAVEAVPFADRFQDPDHLQAVRREDLRRLRRLAGVRAVAAVDFFPLGGNGRFTFRRAAGSDLDPVGAPYFFVGRDAARALGLEITAGRDLEEADHAAEEAMLAAIAEAAASGNGADGDDGDRLRDQVSNVLVTRALADLIYPDGDAVGRLIESEEGRRERIVGIVERMHNAWPESEYAEYAMLYPRPPDSNRMMRYVLRRAPGPVDGDLPAAIEADLLAADAGRTFSVRPLSELKAEIYGDSRTLATLLGSLVVLLLLVSSLGVVGLTSYSVTQRYRQLGTRRALGARRGDVVGHFLVENGIVTAAGLAGGVILAYLLSYGLARFSEGPALALPVLLTAVAALAVTSLLAALVPALRGAAVPPVVATRTL